jgi:hypothetical protein
VLIQELQEIPEQEEPLEIREVWVLMETLVILLLLLVLFFQVDLVEMLV